MSAEAAGLAAVAESSVQGKGPPLRLSGGDTGDYPSQEESKEGRKAWQGRAGQGREKKIVNCQGKCGNYCVSDVLFLVYGKLRSNTNLGSGGGLHTAHIRVINLSLSVLTRDVSLGNIYIHS